MDLEAKLYDREGNEVELKPGHVIVMGKDSFMQVPMDEHKAQLVYKENLDVWDEHYQKAKDMITEWGETATLRRLKSE